MKAITLVFLIFLKGADGHPDGVIPGDAHQGHGSQIYETEEQCQERVKWFYTKGAYQLKKNGGIYVGVQCMTPQDHLDMLRDYQPYIRKRFGTKS